MKKILIIIFVLISFSFVSPLNLNLKTEFSQGETFYAVLEGDIENVLTNNNVVFYRKHIPIPMEVSFLRVGNNYYIATQLIGKQSGNYSIEIQDLEYYELRELKKITLKKNFTISEDIADFLISPPLLATDKNFELTLDNLGSSFKNIQIESPLSFLNNIELSPAEEKKMYFDVSFLDEPEIHLISFSSLNTNYNVPVYVTPKIEPERIHFNTEPSILSLNMSTNVSSNYSRNLWLKNLGNIPLKNIKIGFSESLIDYMNLSQYIISELNEDEIFNLGVFFNSQEIPEFKCGEIIIEIESPEIYFSVPIFLNISESYIPSTSDSEINKDEIGIISPTKSCIELKGFICADNEICEGTSKDSKEGLCCLGVCEEKKSSSSTSKLIGWILIIGILGFVVWFYLKKYKGVKPSINFLKASKPKK